MLRNPPMDDNSGVAGVSGTSGYWADTSPATLGSPLGKRGRAVVLRWSMRSRYKLLAKWELWLLTESNGDLLRKWRSSPTRSGSGI